MTVTISQTAQLLLACAASVGAALLLLPLYASASAVLALLQGVTSYVIIRPLCTALALITSQFGAYSEGSWRPNNSYPYLAMATNLSQVRAAAASTAEGAGCCSNGVMSCLSAAATTHTHTWPWLQLVAGQRCASRCLGRRCRTCVWECCCGRPSWGAQTAAIESAGLAQVLNPFAGLVVAHVGEACVITRQANGCSTCAGQRIRLVRLVTKTNGYVHRPIVGQQN